VSQDEPVRPEGGKEGADRRRESAARARTLHQPFEEVIRVAGQVSDPGARTLGRRPQARSIATLRVGYPRPRQDDLRRPGLPTSKSASSVKRLGPPHDFDGSHPEPSERLPRHLEVHLAHVPRHMAGDPTPKILPVLNGRAFGDALTDNAYVEDGYRFHDAFHLSYLAVLGWSPVVRALLRRKRKAISRTDQIEDGGRAIVIEEGISAVLFEAASRSNFFSETRKIDPGLVRLCRNLTAKLEVSVCGSREWERAILDGYAVWGMLHEQGNGAVICDLDSRTIAVRPLSSTELEVHRRACEALTNSSLAAHGGT
jgi:hypothetical protein